MKNSNFNRAIAEALIGEYEASIPQMEEHVFSKRFERKMRKLIRRRRKPYYKLINTAWKRVVCAVAAIGVSMTILLQVDAVKCLFRDFLLYIYEKFSVIQAVDKESRPDTIEEVYTITYDLSEYEVVFNNRDESKVETVYVLGDSVVEFSQCVNKYYDSLWNTEDAEVEKVEIGVSEGIYFTDNHGYKTVIWDNGDYIISISSNLDKNKLIKIAKSVQKVE